MNSRQIESWALRVIDCVKNGQPKEDFLVELKTEWIDTKKAARIIAGHANAARGENILWLIGVDEKKSGADCIVEVDRTELSNWYSSVESCFDELAPSMIPLNIPVDGKTVIALLFETDRAPFVVKNPDGKLPHREVPWRENISIRTAKRSDLIRLLSPLEKIPEIEVIDIEITARIGGHSSDTGNYYPDELRVKSNLYITSKYKERIIIPFHKCKVVFQIPDIPIIESNWIEIQPAHGRGYEYGRGKQGSLTVDSTAHEILIDGAGKVLLEAISERPNLPDSGKNSTVTILIYLHSTNTERPVILSRTLPYPEEKVLS